MLDPAMIRSRPDDVRNAVRDKGDNADIDRWLVLDEERRDLLQKAEKLKSVRNRVSEEIGKRKKGGEDASESIAEMKKTSDEIQALDGDIRRVESTLYDIAARIPNVPHESVPVGDESNNEIIRTTSGSMFGFTGSSNGGMKKRAPRLPIWWTS